MKGLQLSCTVSRVSVLQRIHYMVLIGSHVPDLLQITREEGEGSWKGHRQRQDQEQREGQAQGQRQGERDLQSKGQEEALSQPLCRQVEKEGCSRLGQEVSQPKQRQAQ